MPQESEFKGKYRILDSLPSLKKMLETNSYTNHEVLSSIMTRIKQDIQEIDRVPKMLEQISIEIFQSFVKLMSS